MKVNKSAYNFFFHPLSKKHSGLKKLCAVVVLVALSAISVFSYSLIFTAVNISDRLKDRRITPKPDPKLKPRDPVLAKVQTVKKKHKWQLEQFEKWARQGKWHMFHHDNSHYDWWMFPVSRSSSGQGDTYAVYAPEIALLKSDPDFMRDFRRGAELVARSWGWDITTGQPASPCLPNQKWENWPVRLGKMADSLRLFGEESYRTNMRPFALQRTNWRSFEGWVKSALGLR